MNVNVNHLARLIARTAVRHVAGRWFLNAQAYNGVSWALGLGVAALIPFFGIPCALIGLGVGIPGFVVIHQRNLPRGKVRAWFALALCLLGLVVQVVVIMWLTMR